MTSAPNLEVNAYQPPMLVYDGSCGFCSRSVQFILRHERRHDLLFVPRDSELGKHLRHTHGMEGVESMLWIDSGRVFTESGAVIRAADYLGGWWSLLAAVGSMCPSAPLRWVYRLIARNRRQLSSGAASCVVPSAEQRSRFLI
jgi:predicted DCC family thiol-disulfide oxidoreductase YuxK